MDLKQIQYFIALFEDGSVTRAAKPGSPVCPDCKQIYEKLKNS